jgi:hypothetical protein
VRVFFAALGLTLACCGTSLAGAANDCDQEQDQELSIRGCTLIIDGRAKGKKSCLRQSRQRL